MRRSSPHRLRQIALGVLLLLLIYKIAVLG